MKRLNVNEDTNIYVACPANSATGGPELLHQLVHELNKLGLNAFMFYYNWKKNINPVNDAYLVYQNSFVDEIEDDQNNILIVPEVKTDLLYKFKLIQKVIWWLSVDNYFSFLNSKSKLKKIIKTILYSVRLYPIRIIYKFSKGEKVMHFVQSEYARQMLKSKGFDNVFFLSDYLNKYFIENQLLSLNTPKDNIVLYNPKKGLNFTKSIISHAKDINFVPIENMKREDVAKLLSKAKVYIDFGNHPGKDRLPREAAISGCCVITGKDGSAKYYEDVPIPDEFKIEAKIENIQSIVDKIRQCFENYEINSKKFESYREKIKNEEKRFIDDAKKIFRANI